MTPVYQTKPGPEGNCFAACVASILERKIEDCDIDMSKVKIFRDLLEQMEAKANCKIYYANHEAIQDGFLKTTERYCFVEVCTFVFNNDPYDSNSIWHAVVAEIGDDGKISMRFNPEEQDQRKKSLDQFPAIRKVFFVKPNAKSL
jgi:hypothetical protein